MTSETVKVKNEYFEKLSIGANARIYTAFLEKPFPARTSYWISRVDDAIQSNSKAYFAEKRKLIKRFAVLDEKGNPKPLPASGLIEWDKEKDGEANFIKEQTDLLQIEVDLGIKPIEVDLDDLEARHIIITPLEWGLLPFLKVKEDPEGQKADDG